ncbi:Putative 115 kDa protein in type-1 retrotransposable element R1DM [Eumeta japonica]|uniref:115 kDa protein in type-1 retrotransposable element R1DM n=1 Tax=Eumeta variegata TaxID=151549 RepID=A0A4C1ZB40_EUMVA|nr:Putative 115 kDa protein in type-1 retrotransposable element R1DM [Eumeta japonica]
MPIGPYLDRVRYVCSKLGTDKIILGDVNAWSVWWVERGGCDCGSALLDRVEEWQVVRDVTSSDHNGHVCRANGEAVRSSAPPVHGSTIQQRLDEGLKKDARTKKRRIRNAAPSRREYVVGEYVQAKEVYERAAAEAQTASWKRFCSAQDGESLWDGIYRVIRETGKNREDILLQTDSGLVLSPNESATLLAETFFPDDRVDTDYPHHAEVRRQTDGDDRPPATSGDLPGVDPPFTGAEAAIFRDLGVFLAMANKCLELGYFPRAWKVAAIKVIPKPGKDDYARPKSYRPIGLLPVLGKTVERMLVGRLQWHLMPKLQATQYGFMPQRGTEDALYDLMTYIYKELNLKKDSFNGVIGHRGRLR